jgi:hypothetical protein
MKKIKKWRYYCDYCKKSGGSAFHIQVHEKSCTMNPDRVCNYCGISDNYQHHIPEMVSTLKSCGDDYEQGLVKLKELTENCPGCILAAIRQSKVQRPPEMISDNEYDDGVYLSFDFKKEKESFWREYRDSHDKEDWY